MVKYICEFASDEINKVLNDEHKRKKQDIYGFYLLLGGERMLRERYSHG